MLKVPLIELEAQPSAMETFKNSMAPPIAIVVERFRKTNIDGRPIEVRKYPEEADTKILTYMLLAYDSKYRWDIRSKADLKKMPLLHEFLSSMEYFCETHYIFKHWVCRKNRCSICARAGITVQTPTITYGALCNEVSRWIDNPMPDPLINNFHCFFRIVRGIILNHLVLPLKCW